MHGKKRIYCLCPYCTFHSVNYKKAILHVEFEHPEEERSVWERYDKVLEPEITNG